MFEPEPEAMAQQFLQEVREQFGLTSDASSEEIHAAISKAWPAPTAASTAPIP